MAIQSWISTSLARHFPKTPPKRTTALALEGARNESLSFQVGMRQGNEPPCKVRVTADGPPGWRVRVRRVGYVPIRSHNTPIETDPRDVDGAGQIPGYVPDPLFEETELLLPARETHAFWVMVVPKRGADPGRYKIKVAVQPEDGPEKCHTVGIKLHDVALERRTGFPITHWFYSDALIDWYRTDMFDRRYWSLLDAYLANYTSHGLDTLYVPVFTPPLDGVKRPTQLLRVSKADRGQYRFDWRDVKRYIDLAKQQGVRQFEWCHLFSQWGAERAIRVYGGQGKDEKLLWRPNTLATSKIYREFLSQYLPKLHRFLSAEKILDRSFFHVSDEPHTGEHLKNYRKARDILRGLAPWMKVTDAFKHVEFARQGMTDLPIPNIRTALDFHEEGIPSWCYYC